MARQIGSEWVLQASPVLRLSLVGWDADSLEAIVQTERLSFVEMRQPKIELVNKDGGRTELSCTWKESGSAPAPTRAVDHLRASGKALDRGQSALSILWAGEIWPKFEIEISTRGSSPLNLARLHVETLGARVQVHVD